VDAEGKDVWPRRGIMMAFDPSTAQTEKPAKAKFDPTTVRSEVPAPSVEQPTEEKKGKTFREKATDIGTAIGAGGAVGAIAPEILTGAGMVALWRVSTRCPIFVCWWSTSPWCSGLVLL